MVSNRDLDKLVENWLADIKTLKEFDGGTYLMWYEGYGYYHYNIPELVKDFPIFKPEEYDYFYFYILNEIGEILYVKFPLDGISSPTVQLQIKNNAFITFYGDVNSLSKSILKLCHRFPNETIRHYNHQYYYDPHFIRHFDYMLWIKYGYNIMDILKKRDIMFCFCDD